MMILNGVIGLLFVGKEIYNKNYNNSINIIIYNKIDKNLVQKRPLAFNSSFNYG